MGSSNMKYYINKDYYVLTFVGQLMLVSVTNYLCYQKVLFNNLAACEYWGQSDALFSKGTLLCKAHQ
jgi:hypothetical protein